MPHEDANEELDLGSDDATFGDLGGIGENSEDSDDMILDDPNDWSRPVESKNKKSTDQVENLDIEEGDITKSGTKMKDKSKNKDEELTDEELEARETKVAKDGPEHALKEEPTAPIGKIVKAIIGDKETTLDTGTIVKRKVDGKMVDVKLEDALSEYTGKNVVDKRLKEFAEEKKVWSSEKQKVQQYEAHLKKEMGEVERLVKDAVEGKADPFAAMEKLLDSLGQDSFVYYKKVMESHFEEFAKLYDMSEAEQEAYWTAKENGHLRKVQDRSRISQQQEQANQQVLAQVESAHKEFGIDWEQFNEGLDYLLTLKDGRGKALYQEKALMANPRAVAQYAARMPYITKAETLLKPFEENIDDEQIVSLTDEVVKLLFESKGASEAEVIEWLEANYGVSPAVKSLNARLKKSQAQEEESTDKGSKFKARTRRKEEDEIEDFDDFDI